MISRTTLIKRLIKTGVRPTLAEHCAEAVLALIEKDEDQLLLGDACDKTDVHKVYAIQQVGGATGAFVRNEPDAEIHIARRFKGRP